MRRVLLTDRRRVGGRLRFRERGFDNVGITARSWKVRIKAGKTADFGIAPEEVPVIGLPGNRMSASGPRSRRWLRPGLPKALLGDPETISRASRSSLSLAEESSSHASSRRRTRARARVAIENGTLVGDSAASSRIQDR